MKARKWGIIMSDEILAAQRQRAEQKRLKEAAQRAELRELEHAGRAKAMSEATVANLGIEVPATA